MTIFFSVKRPVRMVSCITSNPIEVGAQRQTERPSWNMLIALAKALALEPRGRGKLIELRDILVAEGECDRAREHWWRFLKVLKQRHAAANDAITAALAGFDGTARTDAEVQMRLPDRAAVCPEGGGKEDQDKSLLSHTRRT